MGPTDGSPSEHCPFEASSHVARAQPLSQSNTLSSADCAKGQRVSHLAIDPFAAHHSGLQRHFVFSYGRVDTQSVQKATIMLSGLGNPRQLAGQVMNFALILSTAFMVRQCATLGLLGSTMK